MRSPILFLFVCTLLFASQTRAQESIRAGGFKPDDRVTFDIAAEDWVTTKTAHAAVAVEAAVNASTAGTMRGEMMKAAGGLAKAEWRLTSFDRTQDQTGMERWSAIFEARLSEADLGGLADSAKKLSKAGLQLTVATVDFTPTLEEMETVRAALRTQIYKIANDQLVSLNAALPGRNYRIALVDFNNSGADATPMPRVIKGQAAMAMMAPGMPSPEPSAPPAPMERSEKVTLTARVVFAADPKFVATPAPAPVPAK